MEFFSSANITLSAKLLEVLYILMGLSLFYVGLKNFKDEKNPHRLGTATFWLSLGVVIAFGRWIPNIINGILIIIMTIPAILKRVSKGKSLAPSEQNVINLANKIGNKIFIPALCIGLFALFFALFTKLGALVGVGIGVIVAMIILKIYSSSNKLTIFLDDLTEVLGSVGTLCMLPMLLASLGAIFTASGVGKIISNFVGTIIPQGNINLAIIVYALGMMLFTIIMGNAFAAITVMTVGIGAPFILEYGVNPALIGMIGLTCGYCGTLLTPMAANFNIVPVAMLNMTDRYGVIKKQIFVALSVLIFQIVYMIIFK